MKKTVFADTLKRNKNLFFLFGVTTAINLSVFLLYHILIEAFLYAEIIIFAFCALLILWDFSRNLKKANRLQSAKHALENGNNELPAPASLSESQYREMIDALWERIRSAELHFAEEQRDMNDWYTVWVHQIKTPIAVLKLKIPASDSAANDLFRIEEYADMALSYIRLGSMQNDLLIKAYPLDELIRETFRKYAAQFIAKKIRLDYTATEQTVITDKKWASCILDQFISNAVKYTENGTVSVTVNGNTLTVCDTGIGIAAEDLPRIFEKGYTGSNGRSGAESSGLGLYLSAKAAKLIGAVLSVESTVGGGSRFSVTFPER